MWTLEFWLKLTFQFCAKQNAYVKIYLKAITEAMTNDNATLLHRPNQVTLAFGMNK